MNTCCGRSLKQGLFLICFFQFLIYTIYGIFIFLVFLKSNSILSFFPSLTTGTAITMQVEAALVISCSCNLTGFVLSFMKPVKSLSNLYRAYAWLILLTALGWLTCSFMVGRSLRTYLYEYSLSNYMLKKSTEFKNTFLQKAFSIGSMTVASTVQNALLNQAGKALGTPVNLLIYWANYPNMLIATFGLPPVLHALICFLPILELAKVIEAGGDGTEFVDADNIPRYQRLSRKEKAKVRDHQGNFDIESDEVEEIEESSSSGSSL
jgi:hypothetical protein